MVQGMIVTFKSYYFRHTFSQLLSATDGEGKPTVKQFWWEYNILKAINNIVISGMKLCHHV